MMIGAVDVGIMDQLKENDIGDPVRGQILHFIQQSVFVVHTAMLGKAKEGVGGYQLVLMSNILQKTSHEIVVPGMPPWR